MYNPKVVTLPPGDYIMVCRNCGAFSRVTTLDRTCRRVGVYCFHCKQEAGRHYRVKMFDRMDFDENYNSKLNCDSFMVADLHNPIKYAVGSIKHIYLKGVYKGDARIVLAKAMPKGQMNPFVSKLAFGTGTDEAVRIIQRKNATKRLDWATATLVIVLFEYMRESREPSLF